MSETAWTPAERAVYRATFDDDPDAYERTRPVAPAAVFDEFAALAQLHAGSKVLEIGPGTGQATRPLAARGFRVLALELGPRLAERARQNLADLADVEVVTTSFEAWSPRDQRFDAVFACNSFHWIDPEVRFVRAAAALEPHGHLAVLSTPWVVPDDADRFWWDVQDDYVAVGAERVDPATKHPDLVRGLADAVRESRLFEEPTVVRHLFDVTYTADDYASELSTQSGVKMFDAGARIELIERVRRRIEARGGLLTCHLLAVLTVAKLARSR
jgi:SAM-dependent methyltransferase